MALAPKLVAGNVHLIVDDLQGEVARLRAAGAQFRNDIVNGPGGTQILLRDPSENLVELFQPAPTNSTTLPSRPKSVQSTTA